MLVDAYFMSSYVLMVFMLVFWVLSLVVCLGAFLDFVLCFGVGFVICVFGFVLVLYFRRAYPALWCCGRAELWVLRVL